MRVDRQPPDPGPLVDAELVLFVDHNQPQPRELYPLLSKCLGPNH